MNRKPVIQKLGRFQGRTIVISDIHGALRTYQKLLKKIDYKPGKDRLILLGDLVEKGDQSLATLRFIMKQMEAGSVYPMMGNCDFVAKNVLFSYRLDFLKQVLLNRKNSLIHEMIAEAGLPALTEETDMDELCYELRKRYLKELSFLNDLPHVIDTPDYILAHSGIANEKTYADDFRDIMTRFRFDQEDVYFSKPVIVGHMPVSEYCVLYPSFNPKLNKEKNIISIDGGNVVKKAGQLNALILSHNTLRFVNTDLLPKVRALHTTRPENHYPFYINFSQGDVELLEEGKDQSLVYSPHLHRRVWVDNEFLIDGKASNFTNYELPLIAGQTVHLVNIWGDKAQVKHHGVMGWTDLTNLSYDPVLEHEDTDLNW